MRNVILASCIAFFIAGLALWSIRDRPAQPSSRSTWTPFDPNRMNRIGQLNLRSLNEGTAGDEGFIEARGGAFVHGDSGRPVRFWGVNIPPRRLPDSDLRECARLLGENGVNLVRLHESLFDEAGDLDPTSVQKFIAVVEALKEQGIYSYLSMYWWAWLTPRTDTPWLDGYDGTTKPVAAIFADSRFQERYREWWKALLLTPSEATGRRLIDDPAVAGLEIQNEDSLFFATFNPEELPEAQRTLFEERFGEWLLDRYPTLEAALAEWDGPRMDRDSPEAGRIAIRPLAQVIRDRTARDRETVRFLLDLQIAFYSETYAFLRELGFRGMIGASNWKTVSQEYLDPLEALSYTVGDFIDRHAYLGADRTGVDATWAVRQGQLFRNRSALRLEPREGTSSTALFHPSMVTHFDGKPTMLSEVAWERPNRHRSEAPLSLAVYGALQHEDAIIHFTLDGCRWSTSPRPDVQQPWTLASPGGMAQFPASALIYRRGLVATGDPVASFQLNVAELESLTRGSPNVFRDLDPLAHLVGQVLVHFTRAAGSAQFANLAPYVNRDAGVVISNTGEIDLDYRRGLLRIDAPQAQGASGTLGGRGPIETRDLVITTDLEVGHIVAVALDDQPLDRSTRILLQAMSEEAPSGFVTEPGPSGTLRIQKLGHDPWTIRSIAGTVRFKRADASRFRVTPLEAEERAAPAGDAGTVHLRPGTTHYLIESY